MLSERDIQIVALGFLKNYYRMRPRNEYHPTVSGLDMRGEGGIVADGFITFRTVEDQPFTATFEATSADKSYEVHYALRRPLLHADSAVITLWMALFFLVVLHVAGWRPLTVYALVPTLLGLMGAIGIFGGITYLLLHPWQRYRYIHAIDQFKLYHADEQWVFFGSDVFKSEHGDGYTELVRQCIRYGFGLVEVGADRKPVLRAAPSRADNFAGSRAIVNFMPLAELRSRLEQLPVWQHVNPENLVPNNLREQHWLQQSRAAIRRIWQRGARSIWRSDSSVGVQMRKLGEQVRKFMQPLQRPGYTVPYTTQVLLSTTALLIMTIILFNQWDARPIVYVNEGIYARRLAKSELLPEPLYYIVDAPISPFGDTLYQPYILPEQRDQYQEIIETMANTPAGESAQIDIRMYVSEPGQRPAFYFNCDRLLLYDTTVYYLQDTFMPNLDAARSYLDEVNALGVSGTAVWAACLSGVSAGFLVYIDELNPDSIDAAIRREELLLRLRPLGSTLEVQELRPVRRSVN